MGLRWISSAPTSATSFCLLRWTGDEVLPPVVIRLELVGAVLRIGEEGRVGEAYSYPNGQVALEAAREQLERAVSDEGTTLFCEGCRTASSRSVSVPIR